MHPSGIVCFLFIWGYITSRQSTLSALRWQNNRFERDIGPPKFLYWSVRWGVNDLWKRRSLWETLWFWNFWLLTASCKRLSIPRKILYSIFWISHKVNSKDMPILAYRLPFWLRSSSYDTTRRASRRTSDPALQRDRGNVTTTSLFAPGLWSPPTFAPLRKTNDLTRLSSEQSRPWCVNECFYLRGIVGQACKD